MESPKSSSAAFGLPGDPVPFLPAAVEAPKVSALGGLPDDPVVEILSRIPAESLRQFKRVARAWRDLLTDPLHRKRLPQTLEGFFHGGGGGDDDGYGHFTSVYRRSARLVNPSFPFLTKLPGMKRMALLDSCNGLLLFGCTQGKGFGYIVCNPATKQWVSVAGAGSAPPPYQPGVSDMERRYAHTFLMFDPSVSDHFRLVQFWQNLSMEDVEGVHCYSSETGVWNERSSAWKRGEKGGEWGKWGQALMKPAFGRVFVNGMLHFLVYHVKKLEALLVAVDGEGKTCMINRWHEKHDRSEATLIGLSQGLLHCISLNLQLKGLQLHMTELSVWVLDRDTQEWILKQSVSCSKLFGKSSCHFIDFNIVAIHPHHNLIFFVQHWNRKLVVYDMDSKELHSLRTLGDGYRSITPYVPNFMELPALVDKY
ncbi:hypothetical protein ACP4OV_012249 [Aristida adscensionis]